jgi:hypothetical protein
MTSTALAALIAFCMILAVAGVLLLRSLVGGLPMIDRVYTLSPQGRPTKR